MAGMLPKKGRRGIALSACLALCIVFHIASLLTGCSASASSQEGHSFTTSALQQDVTTTITDMAGRKVELPVEVKRVIGIGSSSLRLISYLQATDLVVGVELAERETEVVWAYNYAYQDVFKELPVIGNGGSKGVTPNEEALIEAAPQVIIASVDTDTADLLFERTGIPVVAITLSDVVFSQLFYDNVSLVGSILDKEDRAQNIIQYMKDTEQDLSGRVAVAQRELEGTLTAYAAGINFRGGHGFAGTEASFPPFVALGLKNIADEANRAGAFDIDLEQVLLAQPDLLFIESGNLELVKEDYENNPDYFTALEAVQDGKVYSLIGYRYYATNTELALANCYQVGAQAYPEQFADIDPAKKLDEITSFFLGVELYDALAAEGHTFEAIDLAHL